MNQFAILFDGRVPMGSDRGVRVLPVNTEGRRLCTRSEMQRAVDVLGLFLTCAVGDERLLTPRIPAPRKCRF